MPSTPHPVSLVVLSFAILGGQGGAERSTVSGLQMPQYPFCPPPFERRVGSDETSIVDSCGGFDASGVLINGWEVTSYKDGAQREEHHVNGKLQGFMRVRFDDGDWWIGWYEDGLLEGRREYWYASGAKWQEADFHRGEIRGPGRSWFRDGSVESLFIGGNDKPDPHLEWHEDGTFYRQEGDVQMILKGKTLEQVREANRRPAYGPASRVGSKAHDTTDDSTGGSGGRIFSAPPVDGRSRR